MTTIALTNDDQKHIDSVIQVMPRPDMLIRLLHDLIGHEPDAETLHNYLKAVHKHQENIFPDDSVLHAAVALQRHKMIEYEKTAKGMNLCSLSAALPYLSPWEYRVYRDHILEHLRQQLPAQALFKVIPKLKKSSQDEFTKELPNIINKYISLNI